MSLFKIHLSLPFEQRHSSSLTGMWIRMPLAMMLCAVRLACWSMLVLIELSLRLTLVPFAFLSFAVTMVFGFLLGDARFPRWGMLGFSVASMMLYGVVLGLMSCCMRWRGTP